MTSLWVRSIAVTILANAETPDVAKERKTTYKTIKPFLLFYLSAMEYLRSNR